MINWKDVMSWSVAVGVNFLWFGYLFMYRIPRDLKREDNKPENVARRTLEAMGR